MTALLSGALLALALAGAGAATPTPPASPASSGPSGPTGPAAPARVSPPVPPVPIVRQITWGMGDQNPLFFGDPRWRQLPLRHVRYFVPWDLKQEPHYLRMANQWMKRARRAHAIPLMAITQSNVHGRTRYLPGLRQYKAAVHWITSRYHWVREWTPWNEANLTNQATYHDPARAAAYWKTLRSVCRGCTVTSPSLVGYAKGQPGWFKRFLRAARGLHGPWAIHVYTDVNELRPYATQRFERQLKGPIWVTEVGGWVHFAGLKYNINRQTRAVRFMFKLAEGAFPHVNRWYMYQWFGSSRRSRWDSGLLDPGTKYRARPALRIVQHELLTVPGIH